MSADWIPHVLSDFITIKHGFAFKGAYFKSEITNDYLVTPGNFSVGGGFKSEKFKYYDGPVPEEYVLQEDDLVVTMTDLSKQADTLGYSALIPSIEGHRLLHNQRIGLVKFKNNELDKTFLYFLLRSREYRHHVVSAATGTTVKHTSPTKILSFEFKKPPLALQRDISHQLLVLENKINLNTQTNQTLEQIAQAIFKSWFVDFEPVKAKIAVLEAGGTKEQAELAAMSVISAKDEAALKQLQADQPDAYAELAQTAALFPSAMEESELGEIPEGWVKTELAEVVELNASSWTKKTAPEEIEYVDLANTKWGVISSTEKYPYSEAPSRARRILKNNDTIVGTVRPGNGSYSFIKSDGFTGSTGFAVLTPKSAEYSELVYVCSTSDENIERLAHLADGAAYPAVKPEVVAATLLCLPNIQSLRDAVVANFHRVTKSLFDTRESNFRENVVLSSTRDTLLPKLLSGDLPITNTEVA
jgi:type I restriction enzyme S subunit